MRWLWVDRFTEFVSGSHARGFKNVSLAEEAIDDYSLGYPMLPPTLIIESMAQMGGVLVLQHFDFKKRAVLAKVGKAKYHFPACTGDRLEYHVRLDAVQEDGATIIGQSHIDGKLQADVDLMFAFLGRRTNRRRTALRARRLEFDVEIDEVLPRRRRRRREPDS